LLIKEHDNRLFLFALYYLQYITIYFSKYALLCYVIIIITLLSILVHLLSSIVRVPPVLQHLVYLMYSYRVY